MVCFMIGYLDYQTLIIKQFSVKPNKFYLIEIKYLFNNDSVILKQCYTKTRTVHTHCFAFFSWC